MGVLYIPHGDVTQDSADLLVNTVNTVGVMGKGVALAFRNRWPGIMPPYKVACSAGLLRAGGCMLFPLPAQSPASPMGRRWAALATKAHWRDPSRIEWIESGLAELARLAAEAGVTSIAIPPPGCGNGGLNWRQVAPMVTAMLGNFDLRVHGAPPLPSS